MDQSLLKQLTDRLPEFREKTDAFYAGEVDKGAYKGFSGLYGSYAQKGGKASMLRLRMTAGRVTKDKLSFVADKLKNQPVPRLHFTTCQAIQLHDLEGKVAADIMEQAMAGGIITMGGGGDFPRNVMCTPLTGVQPEECFDVLPWAEAAADYLMNFILAEKMPRKLKVCFSSSPENVPHATYRDLGFVARQDGCFDVYCAGGLGNNPRFGVQVAQKVPPEDILYYIKAMWLTFRAYGNYENRGKARTRYMVEAVGGEEAFRAAYLEKLAEAKQEQLEIHPAPIAFTKQGDGTTAEGRSILPQKQPGLYSVCWHPLGGQPDKAVFCALAELLETVDQAEMRLSPDESAYIINLTGKEAQAVADLLKQDNAATLFETSVSCIGASTCQVGLRDSQALLRACVEAARAAELPDGALPQIHISGCPSSCGTHQTGAIGFRGGVAKVDGKAVPGFVLYVGGESLQGQETMGRELGSLSETAIPAFLVKLGKTVAASGMDYSAWVKANPGALEQLAAEFMGK